MSDAGYSKVLPCPYELCAGDGVLIIRDGPNWGDFYEEPCQCAIDRMRVVATGSLDKPRERAPVASGDACGAAFSESGRGSDGPDYCSLPKGHDGEHKDFHDYGSISSASPETFPGAVV